MSGLKTFVDIRNEYMNETYESFTTEDKENTFGFTDSYVNWLENKLGQANVVTTGEKQCNLPVVVLQSEQLRAFASYLTNEWNCPDIDNEIIEEYIKGS